MQSDVITKKTPWSAREGRVADLPSRQEPHEARGTGVSPLDA